MGTICFAGAWASSHVRMMASTGASARKPKVFVTGATGFVGCNLCSTLEQRGYEVHVLRRSMSRVEELDRLSIVSHVGDALRATGDDLKAILHAAGVVAYSSAMGDVMEQVNVNGTRNVLRALEEMERSTRLVYVSSVVAVGANIKEDDRPLDESAEWLPRGERVGYLRTKRRAEELVIDAAENRAVNAVVVCPSNIYGAGDAKKGSRGNQLKAANGKLRFFTHGGVNVVGVKQCCDAIANAIDCGEVGERYILGGENITIEEMLRLFALAAGSRPPSIALPNWILFIACAVGEFLGSKSLTLERAKVATLYHWYDSGKARKHLALRPTVAKDVIRDSVNWMMANGYIEGKDKCS